MENVASEREIFHADFSGTILESGWLLLMGHFCKIWVDFPF